METDCFEFAASDGLVLQVHRWRSETPGQPRAVVLVAHGMGEHALRYAWLAEQLCGAGYEVFAHDQRGHGATARGPDELGDMGENGWRGAVRDLRELHDRIAAERPDTPRVLLGHSMGSLLARQYLVDHGATFDAAILSGSTDGGRLRLRAGRMVAALETWRLGPRSVSPLLQKALFGKYNDGFGPGETGFEWLSRDAEQVRRYAEDPLCGFVLRAGNLGEMFSGLIEEGRTRNRARIPSELPVYIFSGGRDPVHEGLKGFTRLVDSYRRAGLRRLEKRVYPEARHETLNETNREEVCSDLLSWLASAVPARPDT